jgi:endonuclease/exonuclease/phosphatase family metal-dependent hydrolase
MKLVLLKSLLLTCFITVSLSGAAQNEVPVTSCTDEVSILSWNIFMRPLAIFAKDGQLERAEAIVEQLKHQAYDVIVFQEAFEKKAREILWEGLKEKFPFAAGPGDGGFLKINSGVWILSKFEFTSVASIEYNTCKVADCTSKKGAILVEFLKNGKLFQVIGTHLQAENYPEVRKIQFMDIAEKLLKPFEKENVPQFIVGDLNTMPHEMGYSDMLSLLNAEDCAPRKSKSWLKDLGTWGGRENDLFKADADRKPQLLDYILIKENGKCSSWIDRTIEVIQQAWDKTKTRKDLSDHYAVAAVIRY